MLTRLIAFAGGIAAIALIVPEFASSYLDRRMETASSQQISASPASTTAR